MPVINPHVKKDRKNIQNDNVVYLIQNQNEINYTDLLVYLLTYLCTWEGTMSFNKTIIIQMAIVEAARIMSNGTAIKEVDGKMKFIVNNTDQMHETGSESKLLASKIVQYFYRNMTNMSISAQKDAIIISNVKKIQIITNGMLNIIHTCFQIKHENISTLLNMILHYDNIDTDVIRIAAEIMGTTNEKITEVMRDAGAKFGNQGDSAEEIRSKLEERVPTGDQDNLDESPQTTLQNLVQLYGFESLDTINDRQAMYFLNNLRKTQSFATDYQNLLRKFKEHDNVSDFEEYHKMVKLADCQLRKTGLSDADIDKSLKSEKEKCRLITMGKLPWKKSELKVLGQMTCEDVEHVTNQIRRDLAISDTQTIINKMAGSGAYHSDKKNRVLVIKDTLRKIEKKFWVDAIYTNPTANTSRKEEMVGFVMSKRINEKHEELIQFISKVPNGKLLDIEKAAHEHALKKLIKDFKSKKNSMNDDLRRYIPEEIRVVLDATIGQWMARPEFLVTVLTDVYDYIDFMKMVVRGKSMSKAVLYKLKTGSTMEIVRNFTAIFQELILPILIQPEMQIERDTSITGKSNSPVMDRAYNLLQVVHIDSKVAHTILDHMVMHGVFGVPESYFRVQLDYLTESRARGVEINKEDGDDYIFEILSLDNIDLFLMVQRYKRDGVDDMDKEDITSSQTRAQLFNSYLRDTYNEYAKKLSDVEGKYDDLCNRVQKSFLLKPRHNRELLMAMIPHQRERGGNGEGNGDGDGDGGGNGNIIQQGEFTEYKSDILDKFVDLVESTPDSPSSEAYLIDRHVIYHERINFKCVDINKIDIPNSKYKEKTDLKVLDNYKEIEKLKTDAYKIMDQNEMLRSMGERGTSNISNDGESMEAILTTYDSFINRLKPMQQLVAKTNIYRILDRRRRQDLIKFIDFTTQKKIILQSTSLNSRNKIRITVLKFLHDII